MKNLVKQSDRFILYIEKLWCIITESKKRYQQENAQVTESTT